MNYNPLNNEKGLLHLMVGILICCLIFWVLADVAIKAPRLAPQFMPAHDTIEQING